MAKPYTNLEQSKKLAEILPPESADGYWFKGFPAQPYMVYTKGTPNPGEHIPCWSLAMLFDVLPNSTDIVKEEADTENEKYMCTVGYKNDILSTFGNNSIDVCVAMIERLHELNLL